MPHCGGKAGIDTNCIIYPIRIIIKGLYYFFKSKFFILVIFIESFAV